MTLADRGPPPNARRPVWIPPCLPTLSRRPPSGRDWIHEIKHDGYRAVSVIERGTVSIFTRRGHDWSARMPNVAAALGRLPVKSAVIDGEVIIRGDDGISDFFAVHAALAKRHAPTAVLFAFDLMHLNGEDMRGRPLEDRRALLADLLRAPRPWLQFSEEIPGDGSQVLRVACEMGLEGIISKGRQSAYVSGRVKTWLKTKCTLTEHFAVIGAAPKRGPVRALKLARLVGGELVSCGWAGSGLSDRQGQLIRVALDAGSAIIVEVGYRELTPAGELRHPVIKGWRAE